jgi:hypothetical protein
MQAQKCERVTLKIVNLTKSGSILRSLGRPYYSFDNENWLPYEA